uniref:BTB domain-containing protein n=1 Tax=Eutreptiella gymnastica TaxID=73025 RepID=A0A7S1N863_9EUGL|mmetsp:Transcript_135690/g.235484  ORF Transcript_135690/g.235484 Transcript_135690/m.235484 type:complete len:491 (+) Transcript_135690:31-1503(+)
MLVTTLAGSAEGDHIDGEGLNARFFNPRGLEVDNSGNVYVVDCSNCSIRRISPEGHVSTVAGMTAERSRIQSRIDGPVEGARFRNPDDLTLDADGNIYVTDAGVIRKISSGQVHTLKFDIPVEYNVPSSGDEDGTPTSLAMDSRGNLVLATGHRILRVNSEDLVCTVLASIPTAEITAVAVDDHDNVIFTEETEGCLGIWKVAGGSLSPVLIGPGSTGSMISTGGVAVDGDGNVILADIHRGTILMVSLQGQLSVLFEGSTSQESEGPPADLLSPHGLALDGEGNIIVADCEHHCIRKMHAQLTPPRRLEKPPLASTFVADLRGAYESGLMADVVLVVGEDHIPAHRVILASRSEYFSTVLKSGFEEAAARRIEIQDATTMAVRALLAYLYTDQVLVQDDILIDVMELAHRYGVERLHRECVRQCRRRVTPKTAVPWFIQCHAHQQHEARDCMFRYVTRNFKIIRAEARDTIEMLSVHPELMVSVVLQLE